ncbi:MlaD family protein [Rhizosaccharibacter radicis]|uniref:MlaD family protein n=1 Tax=Rhizosaccharibacter radicis TaxID=2782605 RepID=A0ABT1VZK0_9PROT|nr:MlaD family protein [Acetobacteraceae bacterium KSS12]
MLQNRRGDPVRRMLRLRHTDEWVGLLVLLSLTAFGAAVVEAGVLHTWLQPASRLRIVLPQTGVGGLAVGADVEVLGLHAGTVRRLVLNEQGDMYAVAEIDQQADAFIRHDSVATIRRRYAVAGAAYVDISRGKGDRLDWDYAVIQAQTEPNVVDTVTRTVDDVRARVLPILDNARAMTATLNGIATDLRGGKGSAGRLLTDDALFRQAAAILDQLHDTLDRLRPLQAQLAAAATHGNAALANVQAASADLRRATPQLPAISRHAADATAQLPALLSQTQEATDQLSKLLQQLRGWWLLGGSGAPKPAPQLLPPAAVQP